MSGMQHLEANEMEVVVKNRKRKVIVPVFVVNSVER